MYVVTVVFVTVPDSVEVFHAAVIAQAENSLTRETGCQVFDVAIDPAHPEVVFLYEVYDDEAAFQVHLESDHFRDFDAKVQPMLQSKDVKIYGLLSPTSART